MNRKCDVCYPVGINLSSIHPFTLCSRCGHCIECIDVTRHMSFNIGNAVKYLWRFQDKNGIEDLKKARWYLEDEIARRESKTEVVKR